jgi:hypothetical protein
MDGRRFDDLIRRLATPAPRRGILAAAGAMLAEALPGRTTGAADDCKKVGRRCDRNDDCCEGATCVDEECACRGDRTECNGLCYRLDSDETNCGGCGVVCAKGETCCGGACVDAGSDADHCGGCNAACAEGQGCCGGVCTDLDDDANCGACGARCGAGETCCGGACVDAGSDADHCGGCGNRCPGICATVDDDWGIRLVCRGPRCCSGGVCVEDDRFNDDHCGACNNACASGEACCEGACLDVNGDNANCGGCGVRCGADESCRDGRCVDLNDGGCGEDCAANAQCCDGRCVGLSDEFNCGTCGNTCSPRAPSPADEGYGHCCDGRCIRDILSNRQHCGGCGNQCSGADCCLGECCPQGTACTYDPVRKELGCFGNAGARIPSEPNRGGRA